ncbi:MAG TPA: hypothetical protein ENJ38_03980 [Rhodospirillales bacterium]|nr:hypothetical protein [Rhodospirillales bacterium]
MRNLLRSRASIASSWATVGVALAGLLLLFGAGTVGATTLPDTLFGSWRGDGGAVTEVTIERAEEGFRARLGFGDGERLDIRFEPAERPEVFAAVRSRGLFELFSLSAPKSPLERGRFEWARFADGALYIYRLRLSRDGGFLLDRLEIRREGPDLAVTLQRRRHAREPVESHLRLRPVG